MGSGNGTFKRQLKVVIAQVTEEMIRRAELDPRIGPDALLKQHRRYRKVTLRQFLGRYLCPPSKTVADAMFGEPGWVIVGEDLSFTRLPEEGLPALPSEATYAALIDFLAERVVRQS